MKIDSDTIPKIMFFAALFAFTYAYGILSHKYDLFPYYLIREAAQSFQEVKESLSADKLLYVENDGYAEKVSVYYPDQLSEGLILIMGVGDERKNFIGVFDRAGNLIHELRPDWFEIWGSDEGNFDDKRRPKSQPGALLHGLDFLASDDIVVNFENLSTMRMDWCGEVVWKLDNLGHHSVHVAEDNSIWVAAEEVGEEISGKYRNYVLPFRSWTLQHISSDGEILETLPVFDIIRDNDLEGLLYLSTLSNKKTEVFGDTLHLNDIETFPSGFRSEIFEAGDILFSLRNVNAVLVMDGETHKIKFHSVGNGLRQHDPDFMDNDAISIFDNRVLLPSGGQENQRSRIIEINARTGESKTVAGGEQGVKYFTDIMGVHQRLPNGNILIASSMEGRVLETLPDGSVAWVFANKRGENQLGLVTMAMLLPPHMDTEFFETKKAQCH